MVVGGPLILSLRVTTDDISVYILNIRPDFCFLCYILILFFTYLILYICISISVSLITAAIFTTYNNHIYCIWNIFILLLRHIYLKS